MSGVSQRGSRAKIIGLAVVLTLTCSGVGYAAARASTTVTSVRACRNASAVLVARKASGVCPTGSRAVTVSVPGVRGVTGAPGPKGLQGAPGATGDVGPVGAAAAKSHVFSAHGAAHADDGTLTLENGYVVSWHCLGLDQGQSPRALVSVHTGEHVFVHGIAVVDDPGATGWFVGTQKYSAAGAYLVAQEVPAAQDLYIDLNTGLGPGGQINVTVFGNASRKAIVLRLRADLENGLDCVLSGNVIAAS
jgi:hypothetical protein